MEEKIDYFKVGNRTKPVISNSSLSYIDPNSNGSPQSFLNFFEEKQEQEKSYYRTGHLIHKWAEDKKNFCVSSVNKPTEKLGQIADLVIEQVKQGVVFTDELCFEVAQALNFQSNWKPETIKTKVVEGIKEYVTEVITCLEDNQIYLTEAESVVIDSATNSVEKHPIAKDLLFMQDTDFSNKKVFKELEVYWTKVFTRSFPPTLSFPDGEQKTVQLSFKAKLDSLIIDFDKRKIIYSDPKTTSSGAYGFSKSFQGFKYYRQQAFYNWAIREFCSQQNIDIEGFTWENYNIVIETNGLFQTAVYEITVDWLAKGKREYQELVRRLVEHTATNQWDYSIEEMNNNMIMKIPFEV